MPIRFINIWFSIENYTGNLIPSTLLISTQNLLHLTKNKASQATPFLLTKHLNHFLPNISHKDIYRIEDTSQKKIASHSLLIHHKWSHTYVLYFEAAFSSCFSDCVVVWLLVWIHLARTKRPRKGLFRSNSSQKSVVIMGSFSHHRISFKPTNKKKPRGIVPNEVEIICS